MGEAGSLSQCHLHPVTEGGVRVCCERHRGFSQNQETLEGCHGDGPAVNYDSVGCC